MVKVFNDLELPEVHCRYGYSRGGVSGGGQSFLQYCQPSRSSLPSGFDGYNTSGSSKWKSLIYKNNNNKYIIFFSKQPWAVNAAQDAPADTVICPMPFPTFQSLLIVAYVCDLQYRTKDWKKYWSISSAIRIYLLYTVRKTMRLILFIPLYCFYISLLSFRF